MESLTSKSQINIVSTGQAGKTGASLNPQAMPSSGSISSMLADVRNNITSDIQSNASSQPQETLLTNGSSNMQPNLVSSPDENQILDQLKMDTTGLSHESINLAQAIVKAMLAVTDARLSAERRRHDREVESLKLQIQDLVEQRDDLENYGRRSTIVISGPSITPARTHEDCFETSIELIASKVGIPISRNDIDICHRLPVAKSDDPSRPTDPSKKPIIVKFVRRETKQQVLKASREKKPTAIFFNESLSRTRSKILYVIRKVKREYGAKIASYKTEDCNIRVFTPSLADRNRLEVTTVNTRRKLDEFLMTKLGFMSTRYLEEHKWKA